MSVQGLTSQQKWKRGVWAVAFAAVIFVGSLTGAQLKSDKQKEEAIQEFRGTNYAQQIAVLESQKKHLLHQKAGLERKVDLFRERLKERQEELAKKAR